MKSIFIIPGAVLLILTTTCASPKQTSPAPGQVPAIPPLTDSSQSDLPLPIVETTLPQEITNSSIRTESPGRTTIPESGVMLEDNGKTFTMKTGESFLLNLGTDIYDWTVSVDNENVLRLKVGFMVIQGAQGIYDALAPGMAILSAAGNPKCLQSTPPCGMPSILFSVTVIVE